MRTTIVLTELVAARDQATGAELAEHVHGVEVDDFEPRVPKGVREIGLIAREVEETDPETGEKVYVLDHDVMDVLLGYSRAGIKTLLEVPTELRLDKRDVLIMAQNCGFDVTILAPQTGIEASEAQWGRYTELLCDYAREYIGQPQQRQMLYPICGYIQYMIMRFFGNPPEQVASDPYIQARFVETMTPERMNSVKAALDEAIVEALGGENEFARFCHTLAHATGRSIESMARQVAAARSSA